MKNIFIITALLYIFTGCKKDFGDLNKDQKNPDLVPSSTLFSNAQKNMAYMLADADPNNNIFRLVSQQWTQTTYTDESNYDLKTRAVPDNWWTIFYKDCLRDFDEARKLIPTDVKDPAIQQNELAITDIQQVYIYQILVNTFGDIPFTYALDATILFPAYDDAATIYDNLLARLDADIAALDPAAGTFAEGADLIYNGDVTKWKKFANSLKLVMGMILSDVDPAKAKSIVESAAPGAFTSNDDNAVFNFLSSPPNTNPVWVNLVQSGRNDFIPATTIIGLLEDLHDPRLPLYFTKDPGGGFSGGIPGSGNNFSSFSHVTDAQNEPDAPFVLLDYAQVAFNLAEAAEREMNVGSAEDHYNKAIAASIMSWGGTVSEAETYLGQPSVNYATAAGTWKEKIARQEYLALYNRGFDAWTLIRRLDYPEMAVPLNAQSDFPVRFTYPVLEQNINTSNYNAASAAIGGDDVTTKLFWDIY